ncbi:unnamed protein product [Polarella glacialis]|uniref:ACB domain-containing protein n=1 Tax=Polarella glacialis TaxID=89957 RepID=A0A813EPB3_POLGL|nr:unnamed protein product [Polarella glacialis]
MFGNIFGSSSAGKTAEEQMNRAGEEVSHAAQAVGKKAEELFKSSADSATKWEADKKVPQDVLAKIHGLFQQATVGDASGDPPADASMKAKFEAWTVNKGMSKEDAMAAYTKFIDEKKAEYGGA